MVRAQLDLKENHFGSGVLEFVIKLQIGLSDAVKKSFALSLWIAASRPAVRANEPLKAAAGRATTVKLQALIERANY